MFFLLGLLGLVFAGWAPGYIAVRLLKLEARLPVFAGPFALSLIVNNLLVEVLAGAGFYTQRVMVPITLFACLVGTVLLVRDERLSADHIERYFRAWADMVSDLLVPKWVTRTFVTVCGFVVVLLVAALLLHAIRQMAGWEIRGYDPIGSWNRWAIDWSNNHYPTFFWHYPQLMPVAWSICYVMAGNTSIGYFSSSFDILFWIAALETLVFVGFRRRNLFLLLALPLLYYCFKKWIGDTVFQDYADVPVAFMALVTGATVLTNAVADRRANAAALALASGAAMTKQVGLYMLAAAPALLVALEWEASRSFAAARRKAASLTPMALMAAAAAAPIYVYAVIAIRNGTNSSELGYVLNDIFAGKTYFQRIGSAAAGFFEKSPIESFITGAIFLTGIVALADRTFRWIVILIAVPFTFLWAGNFSYDDRNLALAMPYWALASAAGIQQLVRFAACPHGPPARFRARLAAWWVQIEMPPWLRRYGFAGALLLLAALWVTTKAIHMPYAAFQKRQIAVEEKMYGECYDKLQSILRTFSPAHLTLSDWRYACYPKFNNAPGVCRRIFPETFDFSAKAMSQFDNKDLVLILSLPNLTPKLQVQLRSVGLQPVADLHCDEDSRFYVRHKRAN